MIADPRQDQDPAAIGQQRPAPPDDVQPVDGIDALQLLDGIPVRPGTKLTALVVALRRPQGATSLQLMLVTGWQPHTVRGAISGMLRKKFGLNVVLAHNDTGKRVYRVVRALRPRSPFCRFSVCRYWFFNDHRFSVYPSADWAVFDKKIPANQRQCSVCVVGRFNSRCEPQTSVCSLTLAKCCAAAPPRIGFSAGRIRYARRRPMESRIVRASLLSSTTTIGGDHHNHHGR